MTSLTAADSIRNTLANGQHISMADFQIILVGGMLDRQTMISDAMRRKYASMDVKSEYKSNNGMERRFAVETVSPRTGPICASDFPGFPWDEEADKVIKSLKRDTDETLTHLYNRRVQCKPLFDYIIRNRASELKPTQILALHNIDNLVKIRENAKDSIDNMENEESDIEAKLRATLDSAYKELINEKLSSGWTREMAVKDYEDESKRNRLSHAKKHEADEGLPRFDPTPDNIGILDTMFKFDKGPRPKHWEKGSKKKPAVDSS